MKSRQGQKKLWLKLITFTVITTLLCQNAAWAGGYPNRSALASESFFKNFHKYFEKHKSKLNLSLKESYIIYKGLQNIERALFKERRRVTEQTIMRIASKNNAGFSKYIEFTGTLGFKCEEDTGINYCFINVTIGNSYPCQIVFYDKDNPPEYLKTNSISGWKPEDDQYARERGFWICHVKKMITEVIKEPLKVKPQTPPAKKGKIRDERATFVEVAIMTVAIIVGIVFIATYGGTAFYSIVDRNIIGIICYGFVLTGALYLIISCIVLPKLRRRYVSREDGDNTTFIKLMVIIATLSILTGFVGLLIFYWKYILYGLLGVGLAITLYLIIWHVALYVTWYIWGSRGEDNHFLIRHAGWLSRIYGEKVIPLLEPALKDENPRIRREAIELLGRIGTKKALLALQAALRNGDYWVQQSVAEALFEVLDKNPEAEGDYLREHGLNYRDVIRAYISIRDGRWDYVVKLGASAIPALEHALKAEKPYVRRSAAEALAKMGNEKGLEYLIRELRGTNKLRVRSAKVFLESLGYRFRDEPEGLINPKPVSISDFRREVWHSGLVIHITFVHDGKTKKWMGRPIPPDGPEGPAKCKKQTPPARKSRQAGLSYVDVMALIIAVALFIGTLYDKTFQGFLINAPIAYGMFWLLGVGIFTVIFLLMWRALLSPVKWDPEGLEYEDGLIRRIGAGILDVIERLRARSVIARGRWGIWHGLFKAIFKVIGVNRASRLLHSLRILYGRDNIIDFLLERAAGALNDLLPEGVEEVTLESTAEPRDLLVSRFIFQSEMPTFVKGEYKYAHRYVDEDHPIDLVAGDQLIRIVKTFGKLILYVYVPHGRWRSIVKYEFENNGVINIGQGKEVTEEYIVEGENSEDKRIIGVKTVNDIELSPHNKKASPRHIRLKIESVKGFKTKIIFEDLNSPNGSVLCEYGRFYDPYIPEEAEQADRFMNMFIKRLNFNIDFTKKGWRTELIVNFKGMLGKLLEGMADELAMKLFIHKYSDRFLSNWIRDIETFKDDILFLRKMKVNLIIRRRGFFNKDFRRLVRRHVKMLRRIPMGYLDKCKEFFPYVVSDTQTELLMAGAEGLKKDELHGTVMVGNWKFERGSLRFDPDVHHARKFAGRGVVPGSEEEAKRKEMANLYETIGAHELDHHIHLEELKLPPEDFTEMLEVCDNTYWRLPDSNGDYKIVDVVSIMKQACQQSEKLGKQVMLDICRRCVGTSVSRFDSPAELVTYCLSDDVSALRELGYRRFHKVREIAFRNMLCSEIPVAKVVKNGNSVELISFTPEEARAEAEKPEKEGERLLYEIYPFRGDMRLVEHEDKEHKIWISDLMAIRNDTQKLGKRDREYLERVVEETLADQRFEGKEQALKEYMTLLYKIINDPRYSRVIAFFMENMHKVLGDNEVSDKMFLIHNAVNVAIYTAGFQISFRDRYEVLKKIFGFEEPIGRPRPRTRTKPLFTVSRQTLPLWRPRGREGGFYARGLAFVIVVLSGFIALVVKHWGALSPWILAGITIVLIVCGVLGLVLVFPEWWHMAGLESWNPNERKESAEKLGRLGYKKAIPGLASILENEDEHRDVRISAAEALYRLGDERGYDYLALPKPERSIPTTDAEREIDTQV